MTYQITLYEADVSPEQLREAERRFRDALEEVLGSAEMVMPVYQAYQRLIGAYGESPDIDNLTDAERAQLLPSGQQSVAPIAVELPDACV